jgi:hypothetical protein
MATDNKDKLSDLDIIELCQEKFDAESGLIHVTEVADAVMKQRPVLTISLAPKDCEPPMLMMNASIARSSERDELITLAIECLKLELRGGPNF